MKQAIISIIVIALSILVWLHWGGLSNDLGTLIIALAYVLFITIIVDKHGKKSTAKE